MILRNIRMGLSVLFAMSLPCLLATAAQTEQKPFVVTPEITYLVMKSETVVAATPGVCAAAIGSLREGQKALSTGETNNGWKQVYYIGQIGYIQVFKTEPYVKKAESVSKWKLDFTEERVQINILGDSITYGDKLSSQEKSYASRLATLLSAEKSNNYGWNGSAIGGTHPDRFVDRYPSMDAEADLILVFGGTNDYGCLGDEYGTELGKMGDVTDTTFYGALNQLICGLQQKYPDSEVVFLTPLVRKNVMQKNQFGFLLVDYVNAIKAMADFYGIRVIDLHAAKELDFAGKYAGYLVDGLHPNATGHKMIADYLADTLKTW